LLGLSIKNNDAKSQSALIMCIYSICEAFMIIEIVSQIVRLLDNSNDHIAVIAADALAMNSSTFRMGERDVCNYFRRVSESNFGNKGSKADLFQCLGWSRTHRSGTYSVSVVKGRRYAVVPSR
jgi:hypothetical protein